MTADEQESFSRQLAKRPAIRSLEFEPMSMNYDGPICVEYCGEGDPRVAAESDMNYVKKSLDWLRAQASS